MTKMLRLKRQKKRLLISALLICFCLMGSLTYAWYVSQSSLTNSFETGEFDTVVVENFTPPSNWQLGATTDNVVQVVNTGTIDAFTRVELLPNLSFEWYTEDENGECVTTAIEALDFNNKQYAQINHKTIDNLVTAYNADANSEGTYIAYYNIFDTSEPKIPLQGSDNSYLYSDASGNAITGNNAACTNPTFNLPKGLVLYVKATTGTTTVPDSLNEANPTVLETGSNYDFLGYYIRNAGTEAAPDYKFYKIKVSADNSALGTVGSENYYPEYADSTEFVYKYEAQEDGTVNAQMISSLTVSLYEVTVYGYGSDVKTEYGEGKYTELTDDQFNQIIGLNFYHAATDGTDTSTVDKTSVDTNNWYKQSGRKEPTYDTTTQDDTVYYYYRHALKSGNSTPPIIESVTLKDDFAILKAILGYVDYKDSYFIEPDEITNIKFKLYVNELSTQAIYDAAAEVFGPYDTVTESKRLFTYKDSSDLENGGYDYTKYKNYVIGNQVPEETETTTTSPIELLG